jgi:RND family efflux transporter MFP subunit
MSAVLARPLAGVFVALVLALGSGCGGGGSSDGTAADSTAAAGEDQAKAKDGDKKDDKAEAGKQEGEGEAEGEGGGEEGEAKQARERATTVNVAKVFRGPLVVPVIAEGSIRARRKADVSAEVSGRVLKLYVEEGRQVRKGDKLAELDGREYAIAAEEAHARYLNALGAISVEQEKIESSATADSLQAQLSALEEREKKGEITREQRRKMELELGIEALRGGTFRRELIEARTGLTQARADEERAQLNLSRTVIRAPFTGVVGNLDITEGHNLSVGQTICSLVDNVDVEADVGVLESELGGLQVGRPALLVLPALEETLRVKVDVINPEIDPTSRTCRVLMRVKSDGSVRPGMFVRAAIAGKIYEDKLLLPNEAILTRDGRPLVFRVESDQAKWVYVKLGLRNDQFSEIESVLQGGPLDVGTLVVVSDHLTLSHDAKVKVRRVVDSQVAWTSPAAGGSED